MGYVSYMISHMPHFRQVTGARCTEVAARQWWAEYSSGPTTETEQSDGCADFRAWLERDLVLIFNFNSTEE